MMCHVNERTSTMKTENFYFDTKRKESIPITHIFECPWIRSNYLVGYEKQHVADLILFFSFIHTRSRTKVRSCHGDDWMNTRQETVLVFVKPWLVIYKSLITIQNSIQSFLNFVWTAWIPSFYTIFRFHQCHVQSYLLHAVLTLNLK